MIREAFSFVELLVVVTIIALLASMVMPIIGIVRESARMTRCMSNQRQITTALIAYTAGYKSFFPPQGDRGAGAHYPACENLWKCLIGEGLIDGKRVGSNITGGEMTRVWACPGNFRTPQAINISTSSSYGGAGLSNSESYYAQDTLDSTLTVYPNGTGQYQGCPLGNRLISVQAPSKCYLLGDTDNGAALIRDGQAIHARHRRFTGQIFSFVDGHARFTPAAIMRGAVAGYNDQGLYTIWASDDATINPARY